MQVKYVELIHRVWVNKDANVFDRWYIVALNKNIYSLIQVLAVIQTSL